MSWVLDRGAKAWMYKTAYKNHWRVCEWIDLDDLIQEGYECFYYAAARYTTAVDRPHQMCLFQRVYCSRIEDMAKQKRRQVDFCVGDLFDEDWRHDAELQQISDLIHSAPTPFQKVFTLLTTEEGCRKLRAAYRLRRDGTRETSAERMNRLLGIPKNYDINKAMEEYFS